MTVYADLTVIANDAPRPYHPSAAALVIEVAVSSQHRDLRTKPLLYARARVPEYWVIDIDASRVVIHRDATMAGYGTVLEVPSDGSLQAHSLPRPALELRELFAAANR